MEERIFYVYKYVTEDGIPYYIGKGKGDRIRAKHKNVIVPEEKYRQYIQTDLSESEACDLENNLIREYGRKIDGGLLENIKTNRWACTSGWTHSADAKQKISNRNAGKIRTEEAKIKYKKPKSIEHRENIRKANLNRPRDDRYIKIGLSKSKQKWYNNGIITRMFEPGTELPGFIKGRKIGYKHA